jgi:hypothetical protein
MTYVVNAGWDDVPHISDAEKKELLRSIPPHQVDARTKGVPMLGSGAIYPVDEREVACDPILLPNYWPRGYGMDVGWNWTAALWIAHDLDSDIMYVYDVYKYPKAEPTIHAAAIRARGDWMEGEIDPSARARSQKDGEQLLALYQELGLNLNPADNAVEAGIAAVWDRLSTRRLKVFRHLSDFFSEFRIYRRDENGKVVKQNDHVMDALRYRLMRPARMVGENVGRYGGAPRYRGSV